MDVEPALAVLMPFMQSALLAVGAVRLPIILFETFVVELARAFRIEMPVIVPLPEISDILFEKIFVEKVPEEAVPEKDLYIPYAPAAVPINWALVRIL